MIKKMYENSESNAGKQIQECWETDREMKG